MIIFSDMLQHVLGRYSHYRASANFKALARTDYYRSVETALPGVKVRVVRFLRPGQERRQTERQKVFWRAFFQAAGAKSPEFELGP